MDEWIGPLPDLDARSAHADTRRPLAALVRTGHRRPLAWWAKWTKREVATAFTDVAAVAVTTDTGDEPEAPAFVLADDLDDTPAVDAAPTGAPPVALLPSLDPTIMGWKHRIWYLGPHRAPLFDRTGNAGPTIWVGGCAVGAWSQREGGEVVTRLLEDIPKRDQRRVDAAAGALTAWLDVILMYAALLDPAGAGAGRQPLTSTPAPDERMSAAAASPSPASSSTAAVSRKGTTVDSRGWQHPRRSP